jgi:O-6-methylguanine DNA methyltransferase
MTNLYSRRFDSVVGELLVVATGAGICRICLPAEPLEDRYLWFDKNFSTLPPDQSSPIIDQTIAQLTEYLGRRREAFDIPLDLRGTQFQLLVWEELRKAPYGSTISYGDLARKVGKPGGARAIGAAMASNPVPIVVPCHRVIGHDLSLVGFGGGLSLKEQLLELEQARIPFSGQGGLFS